MRTCDEHGIVYEELKKGRVQPCPVCDCEDEIARHEETNEILRKKLEEMTKKAEDYRDMVAKYQDENADLKQKLVAVREWKKDYFGSLLGDDEDLKKILDGGEG